MFFVPFFERGKLYHIEKQISDALVHDDNKTDNFILGDRLIEAQKNQASAAPAKEDAFDQLAKLKGLLDQGIITEEEFQVKKAELLNL